MSQNFAVKNVVEGCLCNGIFVMFLLLILAKSYYLHLNCHGNLLRHGHPNLEVFLNWTKQFLKQISNYVISVSQWRGSKLCELQLTIIVFSLKKKKKKKIDEGSTVVVWDCHDYMLEAEKHLSDANVYKEVCFNEKILKDLVVTIMSFFKTSNIKEKLVINSLNTLCMSIKTFLTQESFLLYLRFTRSYITFLGDLQSCKIPTEKAF